MDLIKQLRRKKKEVVELLYVFEMEEEKKNKNKNKQQEV